MSKIAIILAHDFADWEYGFLGGVGRAFYNLDAQYFSPMPGEFQSSGGLNVSVSKNLDDLTRWEPHAVGIVGGGVWGTPQAPDISKILRSQHAKGTVIGGICAGTLTLARAGLLNENSHTSNDLNYLQQNADGYLGEKFYQQSAAAVSHNNIITAPGTAPASFAAQMFEAVGLEKETVSQFRAMVQAEHN